MKFNRVGNFCGLFLETLTRRNYILIYLWILVNPVVNWKVLGMSRGFCGGCDDDDDVVSRVLIV